MNVKIEQGSIFVIGNESRFTFEAKRVSQRSVCLDSPRARILISNRLRTRQLYTLGRSK